MRETTSPINRAKDWLFQRQCGCRVTFTGASHHGVASVEPCHGHREPRSRVRLLEGAEVAYQLALLEQPPVGI